MQVYVIHYSDLDGEYGNEDTIRIVFPTKQIAEQFILNAGFVVDDEMEYYGLDDHYKLDDHYSPDFGMDSGYAWIQTYAFEKEP